MNVLLNFAWPNITLYINRMSTENKRKTITCCKIHLYCF